MTETPLDEARTSLAYWESRERALPRRALRGRREARAMAQRWRARVTLAERETYGAGMLGAIVQLLAERRLPEPARSRGRRVVRRSVQAVAFLGVCAISLTTLSVLALVALLT